jgi:hypothetical protein
MADGRLKRMRVRTMVLGQPQSSPSKAVFEVFAEVDEIEWSGGWGF